MPISSTPFDANKIEQVVVTTYRLQERFGTSEGRLIKATIEHVDVSNINTVRIYQVDSCTITINNLRKLKALRNLFTRIIELIESI